MGVERRVLGEPYLRVESASPRISMATPVELGRIAIQKHGSDI
jgi:hypothetical protein